MIGKITLPGPEGAKPRSLNRRLPWKRQTDFVIETTRMHKPIHYREQPTDRIAALEQRVRRLERANTSNGQVSADSRVEAILTLFSLLLRMLHRGPFDLHVYRGQVAAVAELFAEAAGAHSTDEAADLCRLLLASIDPKEPRIRPQLRLVRSRDDPADPLSQEQSTSE
jgi:hypothetical protein